MLTSNVSSSKLLSNDMLQSVGNFLEPESAQKMTETSEKWRDIKMYENIFPSASDVAVFRNVNTEEIIWGTIQFKKFRSWKATIPNQKDLVLHLRQNDSAKWNNVFVWIAENGFKMKNTSKNQLFLKVLMLAIAENVDVTFTAAYGTSPLMIAAAIDDKDSIWTLIKRVANVNQQNDAGWTALRHAAAYGNIDACATLLDNEANIDTIAHDGWTPLMDAAYFGKKNLYEFLIEQGADQTLRDNRFGQTAAQLAFFQYK